MIIFDQLRVSDNGKKLFIDVHVNSASEFESIYLDSITVVNAEDVSETDVCTPSTKYIYKKEYADNQKEAHLALDINNPDVDYKGSFSDTLLFVYVKCKTEGVVNPAIECLPCSLTEMTTLGVTFDENVLYQHVMGYTKELVNDCGIHQGFIDFILLWNAFKAAVETEHYITAIDFYKRLMGESTITKTTKCKCHG